MCNNPIFPTTKGILRKLGGDKISGKTLAWDGDFDDTENIMGTISACKITDKYMDLNSVESLVVKYENGNTKTLTASECIVYTDIGVQVLMPVEEEFPYVSSSPADVEGMMNKGLYFAWTPEFYVEKITFSETIVPIDPKYLPDESVTETINLAAFTTTENTDFNTVLFLSMTQSAQSGGALQTQTVHDAGNALRTACSVGNRIVLKATATLDGHPVFVEFPTMRSMEGGVAAQLSCQSLLYLEGTVLDAQALLVFLRETDNVVVYVKATPLT